MKNVSKPIITTLIAVTFLLGTVGCKMNGGPWYNPKTYSLYNPFERDKGLEAPPYSQENALTPKPSINSTPANISPPPGGYYDTTASRPQFNPADSERLTVNPMMAHNPATGPVDYYTPHGNGGYNPSAVPGVTPQNYQQTSLNNSQSPYSPTYDLPNSYQPNHPPVGMETPPPYSAPYGTGTPGAPQTPQYMMQNVSQPGYTPYTAPAHEAPVGTQYVPNAVPTGQYPVTPSYDGGYTVAPSSYPSSGYGY